MVGLTLRELRKSSFRKQLAQIQPPQELSGILKPGGYPKPDLFSVSRKELGPSSLHHKRAPFALPIRAFGLPEQPTDFGKSPGRTLRIAIRFLKLLALGSGHGTEAPALQNGEDVLRLCHHSVIPLLC